MRGRGKTPFSRQRKAHARQNLPKLDTPMRLISTWWDFVITTPYDIQHEHRYGNYETPNAGVRNVWPNSELKDKSTNVGPYKILKTLNADKTQGNYYQHPDFKVHYADLLRGAIMQALYYGGKLGEGFDDEYLYESLKDFWNNELDHGNNISFDKEFEAVGHLVKTASGSLFLRKTDRLEIFEMSKHLHNMATSQTTRPYAAGTESILYHFTSIHQVSHYPPHIRNHAWALSTQHMLNTNFETYHKESTPMDRLQKRFADAVNYLQESYLTLDEETLPIFNELQKKMDPSDWDDRHNSMQNFMTVIKQTSEAKKMGIKVPSEKETWEILQDTWQRLYASRKKRFVYKLKPWHSFLSGKEETHYDKTYQDMERIDEIIAQNLA